MIDPQYITWLIGNIPDISVPPFFIEKAVKINPFFSIPDKYLDALHHRIQNYLSIFENDFEDFMKNKEYLKYLNLSMEEKKPYLEIYNKKRKEMAEKNLNDFSGKLIAQPKRDQVPIEVTDSYIIEFYSKQYN